VPFVVTNRTGKRCRDGRALVVRVFVAAFIVTGFPFCF